MAHSICFWDLFLVYSRIVVKARGLLAGWGKVIHIGKNIYGPCDIRTQDLSLF